MKKHIQNFRNFRKDTELNEGINDRYYEDENDIDSSEIIEGDTLYQDQLIKYKVEYHEDFGYSFLELSSDEVSEEYIEEHETEIRDQIVLEIGEGITTNTTKPTEYEYIAIDTRNGKIITKSKTPIDRKFVSEFYDLPKAFIEIKIVSQ